MTHDFVTVTDDTVRRPGDFQPFVDVGLPDACWPWLGGRLGDYGRFGRHGYAHHRAFEIAHGPIPDGLQIDHRCRNRLCVNPAHLRLATHAQNVHNTGPRGGSSRFKGVSRSAARARLPWQASIKVNGRSRFLGTYATEEMAAVAYDTAADDAFGEFAYLNFPDRCAA